MDGLKPVLQKRLLHLLDVEIEQGSTKDDMNTSCQWGTSYYPSNGQREATHPDGM
jgi:hypothetical protein